MASLEKQGGRYRQLIGMSDHHPIYRWMPERFEPGDEDTVTDLDAATANPAGSNPETQDTPVAKVEGAN